jgi:hypothetical protein
MNAFIPLFLYIRYRNFVMFITWSFLLPYFLGNFILLYWRMLFRVYACVLCIIGIVFHDLRVCCKAILLVVLCKHLILYMLHFSYLPSVDTVWSRFYSVMYLNCIWSFAFVYRYGQGRKLFFLVTSLLRDFTFYLIVLLKKQVFLAKSLLSLGLSASVRLSGPLFNLQTSWPTSKNYNTIVMPLGDILSLYFLIPYAH